MALAMSETNIPYIISFMLRKDGCLIDGTPIYKAIEIMIEEMRLLYLESGLKIFGGCCGTMISL